MPPRAPETTLSTPASRSSSFESRSRPRTTSLPLTLNSIAITATNTAGAIPAAWPSTAPPPARPGERADRPRRPQPSRLERPQEPAALLRGRDRRARDEHPDRERHEP